MDKPFKENEYLNGDSVKTLYRWLMLNIDKDNIIAKNYKATDLLNDLSKIIDGMWSDSIDAMGDDA